MCLLMVFQVRLVTKCFPTVSTHKWLLPRVHAAVILQVSNMPETFVAVATYIGLDACVGSLVVTQVCLVAKPFATHGAGKWSLA